MKLFRFNIYYGWWIVIASMLLGLFVSGLVSYCFTAFIQPIAEELQWNYAQISFAASLRVVEIGLTAPLIGWLIDHWGIRKVIFIGLCIVTIGLFLFSSMQSLIVFYIAFVIMGVGTTSCSQSALMTVVAKWFNKRAGLAIGIAVSGLGLAGLFIPIVTSLITIYGWRSTALIILICILLTAIPLTLVLRNKPEDYGLVPDGDSEKNNHSQIDSYTLNKSGTNNDHSLNLRQALRGSVFWKLSFAYVIMYFVQSAVTTHIMPYLSSIHIDRQSSSFIAAGMPIMSIIGRIGFGFLSDKYNKKMVAISSFSLLFLMVLFFEVASSFGIFLVTMTVILFGIGFGGAVSLSGVLIRQKFGKKFFGSIFGAMVGTTVLGHLTGAVVAGWIFDQWHSYQIFWFLAATMLLVAIVLIKMINLKSDHSV